MLNLIFFFANHLASLIVGCALRYASGSLPEYEFANNLLNDTMIDELNITQVYTGKCPCK